ncbi:MAG TPA: hypothetical protein VHN11_04350 [Xanthobacteraceae bacterium]|jgi:hypothetical protein|nr:hypothetical protein [Xanthobacteraceae bacterium]
MRSKLLEEARRSRLAAHQKLTPEQRLGAYLVHNRLVAQLREAGRQMRESARPSTDEPLEKD